MMRMQCMCHHSPGPLYTGIADKTVLRVIVPRLEAVGELVELSLQVRHVGSLIPSTYKLVTYKMSVDASCHLTWYSAFLG